MRILLVGTGRVANSFAHALAAIGLEPIGIMGRDPDRTQELADIAKSPALVWGSSLPQVDLIILAVSDKAIAGVAANIPAGDHVMVHTSGATPISLLVPHQHRGCLWPVQTFLDQDPVPLAGVPLICEGSDESALARILELAKALNGRVEVMTYEERRQLHLAAVLASNFPVAMMLEAQRMLEKNGWDPALLLPLWRSTAANLERVGAAMALTGPARRGDLPTLEAHRRLLSEDPELLTIYDRISERIMRHSSDPPDQ